MEIKRCVKESFTVIGKEGSTSEGAGFVQQLWNDANSNFSEIASFAKKDDNGNLVGIWGAMSDFTLSFKPWEDNFTKGLYLAGVEVIDGAQAPNGWTKWTIPSYEYIYIKNQHKNSFTEVLDYFNNHNISLVGAIHDYICPSDNCEYFFLPIQNIKFL